MIRDFESWNSNLGEASALEDLKGYRVAIEAADYINTRILNHQWKERLLPAIGGLPLGMKHYVELDIERFRQYEIQPVFIFSGLEFGKEEDVFRQSRAAADVNANAWELYNQHKADQAVAMFGESNSIKPEDLYRALQATITELNIPFQVAPYSAWAQLAYLEKYCPGQIQAIAGSSELLLFDCDKFITSWDFEQGEVRWLKRDKCISDLKRFAGNGEISQDMFVDACMLAGTHFLATLPQLDGTPRSKVIRPLAAIETIMNTGRSGFTVCQHYQDDPKFRSMNYLDKFKKARLAVKHHPVLTIQGKVEPLDSSHVPNDVHEFIAQRLPDEIYYYLSKGMVGPRVLKWRTYGEIIEIQPLDGGDSEEYKRLVSSKLTTLRTTVIALLSYPMHRFYLHKDLILKCWFNDGQGRPYTSSISMRDLNDPRPLVDKWNVKESGFKDVVANVKGCGMLGSTVTSLKDAKFAATTIVSKDPKNVLSTKDEILFNSVWRFLALREYVDVNHKLTPWGEVLATIITALNGTPELEEAALLAVELIRLGLLNSQNMFNSYGGAPFRGSDDDRKHNLLVSRVACLGTLHHKPIGFTGPLSRHLLAYWSMIDAVRSSLRDVAEVSLTFLLLNGDAKRDIPDAHILGMQLPFLLPNTCALGIAVKSYLDELIVQSEPTSKEAKAAVLKKATEEYFPQCVDLAEDLQTAFKLWDAVYAGVQAAGDLVKDRAMWQEANSWLSVKR